VIGRPASLLQCFSQRKRSHYKHIAKSVEKELDLGEPLGCQDYEDVLSSFTTAL
jgi:hypothetical protein